MEINSSKEFYDILNQNTDLLNDELKIFRDLFYLSLHGCPCNADGNLSEANKIYLNLENLNLGPLESLKKRLEIESMIFFSEGDKFFEF
jgi:hypothetical protein